MTPKKVTKVNMAAFDGASVRAVNTAALAGCETRWQPLPLDPSEREWMDRVIAFARHHGWTVIHALDSRGTEAGLPDLICHRGPGHACRLVVAELKTESGKLTPEQLACLSGFESVCPHVYVWRPADWPAVQRVFAGDHLLKVE